MQFYIIKQLLLTILSIVSDAILKAVAEATIKICRQMVIESENKVDDTILLPLLDRLETAFELDDDDD